MLVNFFMNVKAAIRYSNQKREIVVCIAPTELFHVHPFRKAVKATVVNLYYELYFHCQQSLSIQEGLILKDHLCNANKREMCDLCNY